MDDNDDPTRSIRMMPWRRWSNESHLPCTRCSREDLGLWGTNRSPRLFCDQCWKAMAGVIESDQAAPSPRSNSAVGGVIRDLIDRTLDLETKNRALRERIAGIFRYAEEVDDEE